MRLLKLLGISVVFFFLLLLIFTSLMPSRVRISRAVDIQASGLKVLPYLQNESNWSKWNRWFQDSTRKMTTEPILSNDTLVSTAWLTENRRFVSNYALYEIRKGITTVQWYFDIDLAWYPWEKLGSIVYDNQMGPVMEESLGKLKHLVESNP